jgi:hypothetical protein
VRRRRPSGGGRRAAHGGPAAQAAATWAEQCASARGRWMRSAQSREVRCRRAAGAGGAWLADRRRGVVGSAGAARTERRGCGGGVAAQPRNEACVRRMAAGRHWCAAREQTRREREQVIRLGRARQQERGACAGGVEVHGSERVRVGE